MTNQTPTTACRNFEEDLVLLHYGDLGGAERAMLEKHMASCAGCAGYLKELAILLPLASKTDEPPQEFWMNYNRELRRKIDGSLEQKSWWQSPAAIFRPRLIPAFATAAVIVLALTFTLGKGVWIAKNGAHEDEMADALPVAENLDFFSAMDVLDELDLLEIMGNPGSNAV
jgi:hypothetical protein